eukprot:gene19585-26268_t
MVTYDELQSTLTKKGPSIGLIIAGVIFLSLLIVVIVFVVRYYRMKAESGFDPTKSALVLDAMVDASYKAEVPAVFSAGMNKSQATLTLAFNISAYEQTDNHKIMISLNTKEKEIAKQKVMILLDKDYNNAYFMFNQARAATGSTTIPVDMFCAFELQNIPLYRWTVMHVVYDQANGNAKVYFDGELVKVCNLFVCNKVVQNCFDVNFVNAGHMKSDIGNIEATKMEGIKYRKIMLTPHAKQKGDIVPECQSIFETLKEEEDKRIRDALAASCPSKKM